MKKSLIIAGMLVMCGTSSAFAMDSMGMAKMMTDKHMKMMDTDGDGMVSKDEYMAASEKMMNDMDTNHDGMISKQEMMDAKMKEMKSMGMMSKGSMMKDDGMMDK